MTPKLYKPSPVEAANNLVAELDKCNVNVYITLAKAALWIVAAVLLMLVIAGVTVLARDGFTVYAIEIAGVVVQACQVAAVVAITVLGWHGYKGSRVLHILRNWEGGK